MKRILPALLLILVSGCTHAKQAVPAPAQQAPSPVPTAAAAPPGRRPDIPGCGKPAKPGEPGIWLDIAGRGQYPLARRMYPAWVIPLPSLDTPYDMRVHIPARFDAQQMKVRVESESYRFAPNSGALKAVPDGNEYLFAVEPVQSPGPATVFVSVTGVKRADGSEVGVGPFNLQVYRPEEQVPPCDVPVPPPVN